MLYVSDYSNPLGVGFRPITRTVMNRSGSAVAAGDVMQLDMAASQAETTEYVGTGDDSVFGVAVDVTATGANAYPLVVALEAAADNAQLKVGLAGVFDVSVAGTNATATTDVLHATAAVSLNSDASAGDRVVGIPLATTAAGAAEVIKVFFCGSGLGVK